MVVLFNAEVEHELLFYKIYGALFDTLNLSTAAVILLGSFTCLMCTDRLNVIYILGLE